MASVQAVGDRADHRPAARPDQRLCRRLGRYHHLRFNDALMSFPALILAVVIVGLLGPSLTNAMTAIRPGLRATHHAGRTRQHAVVREEVYIRAARATGCSVPGLSHGMCCRTSSARWWCRRPC